MELKLKRTEYEKTYTAGELRVNGVYFCDTLEDQVRPHGEKVYGETAIPAGKYKIIINKSPKYGREMPLLCDVPGFTGIRIHSGNTADDSHGCVLVGIKTTAGRIGQSRDTYAKLFEVMQKAVENKEEIWIEIL